MKKPKESLKGRIRRHHRLGIKYWELLRLVFPPEENPKSWTYQTNGGPPGCAMAFGRALREMGGMRDMKDDTVFLPAQEEGGEGR